MIVILCDSRGEPLDAAIVRKVGEDELDKLKDIVIDRFAQQLKEFSFKELTGIRQVKKWLSDANNQEPLE